MQRTNLFLLTPLILTLTVPAAFAQGGYGQGQGKGAGGAGGGSGEGARGQGQGQGRPGVPPGLTRLFDANTNGTISKQEMLDTKKVLLQLDKNHDGVLSAEEIRADGQTGGGAGGARGQGQGGRGGAPGRAGQALLVLFDADRNGALSAEEIAKAPVAVARYDRNQDGQLTADDFGPTSGQGGSRGAGGAGGGRGAGGGAGGGRGKGGGAGGGGPRQGR